MPRRRLPQQSNTTEPPQPDPAIENIKALRSNWKWAAFCQFFHTFNHLFSSPDITINDIEKDLAHHTNLVIPRIMHRLLYTLSYDRKVSLSNWQTALRKQYNKRNPSANPIGPEPHNDTVEEEEEEPPVDNHNPCDYADNASEKANSEHPHDSLRNSRFSSAKATSSHPDESQRQPHTPFEQDQHPSPTSKVSLNWLDLPMLTKLESMHTVAEWQFLNPMRLRTIMKSDDDSAAWRIEPIGYDSKFNSYWFIGGDRLWIQRSPPKPPRHLKRKRPQKRAEKSPLKRVATSKRPRLEPATPARPSPPLGPPTRHSRAAKDQAKLKLDAQARELAELNKQAGLAPSRTRLTRQSAVQSQPPPRSTRASLGTRVSARLRGAQEGEWQSIPKEWLDDNNNRKPKTGLESDEETISELTELSEDSDDESRALSSSVKAESDRDDDAETKVSEPQPPADFIEWETICVTLDDWECIADRFVNATHYTEKALYKVLKNNIVPFVVQELKEIVRKRQIEEALVHRKRSSRLAIRESEREEARVQAKRQQEENEKLSRTRRMEARQQKEEMERIKRETAREQRRKEREAREQSRKALTPTPEPEHTEERIEKPSAFVERARIGPRSNSRKESKGSSTHTPLGEDWELACEICKQHGINLDDGTPMMSCGMCSKWQHITCHDRADQAAGRPRRNWDTVEFICRQCRHVQANGYHKYPPSYNHTPHQHQQYGGSASYPSQSYKPIPSVVPPQSPSPMHHTYLREAVHPAYYTPSTNGTYSSGQAQYSSSSRHQLPPLPQLAPHPRATIAFSHYQPAEHGFSSNTQKYYPEPSQYASYSQQTSHYNQQQYAGAPPNPYKSQAVNATWNVATPAQSPGYPTALQNPAPYLNQSTIYRQHPSDSRDYHSTSTTNGGPHASSYPPQMHYAPQQYRQHPTPYQPR